jgi:hypothetical protein
VTTVSDGKAALDALYWRAEILQAMFWMRGEGIATNVEPLRLAEFLAVEPAHIGTQMDALAAEGYLEVATQVPLHYALTATGIAEGGRSFQDEFAELTRSAHYECAPGCWCHDPDHVGEPCPSAPPLTPTPVEPPEEEPQPAEDRRGR